MIVRFEAKKDLKEFSYGLWLWLMSKPIEVSKATIAHIWSRSVGKDWTVL
ncbi:MAG: hypothetical protein ABJH85_00745 [Paracoccaceae bacterium]